MSVLVNQISNNFGFNYPFRFTSSQTQFFHLHTKDDFQSHNFCSTHVSIFRHENTHTSFLSSHSGCNSLGHKKKCCLSTVSKQQIWSERYHSVFILKLYFKENCFSPMLRLDRRKKNRTLRTVYPHVTKTQVCTLMLLTNLADPEWIYVDCNKRILHQVICTKHTNKENSVIFHGISNTTCSEKDIVMNNICYVFVWKS